MTWSASIGCTALDVPQRRRRQCRLAALALGLFLHGAIVLVAFGSGAWFREAGTKSHI
jgi:hypothetical protein